MPSVAASNYQAGAERAHILLTTGIDLRLRPMIRAQIQVYLQASLATSVAAWDAYIHDIVREFFQVIANPLVPGYHTLHKIAQTASEIALKRFNTPNWENSRSLLASYAGYDPIADWIWPSRGMPVAQVKEKLDQILQVRHSFAHGFPLPAYSWTTSANGKVRLTSTAVRDVQLFFANMVRRTDKGLAHHVAIAYGKNPPW